KYKFSLLPSGILTPGVTSVIAGGVVLNPARLIEELDELIERQVAMGELLISDRAHVICPWHWVEDRILDASTSTGENIGTTQQGIGPCYRDKVGRSLAIRVGDMFRPEFRNQVEHITRVKNITLRAMAGDEPFQPLDAGTIHACYAAYANRLQPMVRDTTEFLLTAVEEDRQVLFEGAQGSLLDVDHGTYPYVTSSNSSGVGISNGSGVPARYIHRVIGIVKAYTSRVGGGPFPTEQDTPAGEHLREKGHEYGTVTKRPRRCGWLDAVAVRYAARLSGVDTVAVTLLDVLSGLDELKICIEYEIDGRRTMVYPSHLDDLRRVRPVYETLPGWTEDLTMVRSKDDLPANARAYLNRISQLIARPIDFVSVGPGREQTIRLEKSTDGSNRTR
ncbi:MAG: adenylosuccinate synthase, partial [Pirellulales bacterium]|nr:adenylosuccinate synthase [Pirellulales bacterium]